MTGNQSVIIDPVECKLDTSLYSSFVGLMKFVWNEEAKGTLEIRFYEEKERGRIGLRFV